eukprot:s7_g84.t1
MSCAGFNRVFAAAMVLESVDALSDEEVKKPVEKIPKKSDPKPKANPKAKSSGGPSGMSKAKAKAKRVGVMKKPASACAVTEKEQDEVEEEEEAMDEGDVIPKKPAASDQVANKGMKRPAAAPKRPAKDPKKVKVVKYMYYKTNTYGFKVDKKQDAIVAELIRTEGDVRAATDLKDSMIAAYTNNSVDNADEDLDALEQEAEEGEEEEEMAEDDVAED